MTPCSLKNSALLDGAGPTCICILSCRAQASFCTRILISFARQWRPSKWSILRRQIIGLVWPKLLPIHIFLPHISQARVFHTCEPMSMCLNTAFYVWATPEDSVEFLDVPCLWKLALQFVTLIRKRCLTYNPKSLLHLV